MFKFAFLLFYVVNNKNRPLHVPPRAEIEAMINAKGQSWRQFTAGKMLEALDKGEKLPAHYPVPLSVWQFGEDLTLVGLSGEVVIDFVFMIEKALGPLNLWISAYCHDVYGYLPSARVLEEGGYETRGLYSGGIGFFSADAEKVVVNRLKELANEAGRQAP
jgi:neutral ceramidase